jgi:hypothetical protein
MRWNFCPDCGSQISLLSVDDIIKKCEGPGFHIIGWNGQLWLPAVRKFCLWYGLNKEEIENKRKEREFEAAEVINA